MVLETKTCKTARDEWQQNKQVAQTLEGTRADKKSQGFVQILPHQVRQRNHYHGSKKSKN
jgi:hypothetical protein